jgi:rhamnose utilization protein RhaD (predicted bifunctional aldolase and dehydrogenase)/NAD(P)-dependent dehydrogenase (short-subunit alcohol dehydrogenase family)
MTTGHALDEIAALSREYGASPEWVLAGGGNTSLKTADTLYIKPSGTALAVMRPEDFVALDRAKVRAALASAYPEDSFPREAAIAASLLAARREPGRSQRPSVESTLHELLDRALVVHLHPTKVTGLVCAKDGETLARDVYGDAAVWIPYVDPGYVLSRLVAERLKARPAVARTPVVLLLQSHGIFVAADTATEIRAVYASSAARLDAAIAARGASDRFPVGGPPTPGAPARAWLLALAPALRGALAEGGAPGPVVRPASHAAILGLLETPRGEALALAGPLTPDQIVYCKSLPLWLAPRDGEAPEAVADRIVTAAREYRRAHGYPPRVVLVPGVGAWTVGGSPAEARTVEQVYGESLRAVALAEGLGGARFLAERDRRFIETWEVEQYRRKVAGIGQRGPGRVAGRVAIVTGAAQGFGRGLADGLAAEGAFICVADLNAEGSAVAAREITAAAGAGRAMACGVNVTDGASVAAMVEAVVREYGGIDLLVSNAGVLKAAPTASMPDADFAFVTAVNYTGYFLCVKHTAPVLAAARRASPAYATDIVQINSKSGLGGSSRNAAYAGSKFGGLGLTQSFALEYAADGIKVNAICPGNFFDGPLWSDPEKGLFVQYLRAGKVPGAKTVADVRRFYEAKVPMGRGCEVPDVLRAVLYLVEQQYETGQALPVTGGQVMLS